MRHPGSIIDSGFRDAVLDGLAREAKAIPCKYLYDAQGSALFERICALPEYYLTRTEVAILERHREDIARMAGPGCRIVEFGSGSSRKIRILLEALEAPAAYLPVDISREFLLHSAQELAGDFPRLSIAPVYADFLQAVALPPTAGRRTLGFFPGSTIGNLAPPEACAFLRRARRLLGPDGLMLVGVDRKKAPARLHAAYNDAQGVTAAFVLNLLARINRELDGDFDLDEFEHSALWDARKGCVEIAIVSRRRQEARVDGRRFVLGAREPIHVEDCYKYTPEEFAWLAGEAGFAVAATWTDPEGLFAVHCLRAGDG